jgi:putative hydrolase of the HAD superfamily
MVYLSKSNHYFVLMQTDFSHVKHWVFDLDHTLYHPDVRLFDQIEVLMNTYVQQFLNVTQTEADHLRKHYWSKYGTTLAGLMTEHNLDPEPFMEFVHDISLDGLTHDLELSNLIKNLNGIAIVYTNGSEGHARRVTRARGLGKCFSSYFGVEHASYIPKPHKEAFEQVFKLAKIDPTNAVMFEDDPRNLVEPSRMGMKTVLVGEYSKGDHIHYHTEDLTAFLREISTEKQ